MKVSAFESAVQSLMFLDTNKEVHVSLCKNILGFSGNLLQLYNSKLKNGFLHYIFLYGETKRLLVKTVFFSTSFT